MCESPRLFKKTRVEKSGSKDICLAQNKRRKSTANKCVRYTKLKFQPSLYTQLLRQVHSAHIAHDNDVKRIDTLVALYTLYCMYMCFGTQ